MLVDGVAEVRLGLWRIRESLGRVAGVRRSAGAVRHTHPLVALGVERQVDVARTVAARVADLRRVGLVEDVKEPGAELQLLRLAEVKILEERNVEVAPARSPHVERRLRRPVVGEGRDLQRVDVEYLLAESRAARLRIARVDRRDRADARPRTRAVEGIGAIPGQRLAGSRDVAAESQANRRA